jgi:SAM-dependent methyltransferase
MTGLYDRRALLYDVAVDWDVDDEIDWLLEQLEPSGAPVLEPGCGSGRMLVALARRGVESVGIDLSPAMVALARSRLTAFPGSHSVLQADMTAFDLGHQFGGAICPMRPAVDPDRAVGGLVWHDLRASPRVGQVAGSACRLA